MLYDISSHDFDRKQEIVKNTLKEMGAESIPVITCYNKIDLLAPEKLIEYRLKFPDHIYISAENNLFIGILVGVIRDNFLSWKAGRHTGHTVP